MTTTMTDEQQQVLSWVRETLVYSYVEELIVRVSRPLTRAVPRAHNQAVAAVTLTQVVAVNSPRQREREVTALVTVFLQSRNCAFQLDVCQLHLFRTNHKTLFATPAV